MTDANAGAILARQAQDTLRAALSTSPVRPFLVTVSRSHFGRCAELNVHVAKDVLGEGNVSPRVARHDLATRVAALGLELSVRIKLHSRRDLDRSRSLERFILKFARGERIYDRGDVFDEADRLVRLARELRCQLSEKVSGIFWSARPRILYVVLNKMFFIDGYGFAQNRLATAEKTVVRAYAASAGRAHRANNAREDEFSELCASAPSHNVRLCFQSPALPLVAVDEESVVQNAASWLSVLQFLRMIPQSRALSRIPLITVFLGIGSAGIALAKVPAIEKPPTHTSADKAGAATAVAASEARKTTDATLDGLEPALARSNALPGGSRLLWRDSVAGGEERLASREELVARSITESQGNQISGEPDVVAPDEFRELVRSGAMFGGAAEITRAGLDLKWVNQSDVFDNRGMAQSGSQPQSNEAPIMQTGIAGLVGLSKLAGKDWSDEAYATILEDLRSHFGSLQFLDPHLPAVADRAGETLDHYAAVHRAKHKKKSRRSRRGSSA